MSELLATSKVLRNILGAVSSHSGTKLADRNFDELIPSVKFLESLFPSMVFMLCKMHHEHMQYVSDNCQAILSHSAEDLKNLSPAAYYGLIHPDDARGVRLALEYMYTWAQQEPITDPKQYRISLHYRLRTPGRSYIYVLDEKRAHQTHTGHYTHFSLLKNVTGQQVFTNVRLEIYKLMQGDYRKVDEYSPRASASGITAREKEILRCIREGLTSKQIADKLCISVFTVRNHRSNVFEKAGAQNMVQLVKHAEASGWI